jgi:predicted phosphodiesterase
MKAKILLLIAVFCCNINAAIIMQPYLMGVQSNSVWVLVECSTNDTVTVDFGTTPSYGSTAKTFTISTTTNSTFVHKINLTGLNQNTNYYYRARQMSSTSGGSSFVTAVNEQTPFRFLWIGDYRSGTAVHDQICQLVTQYNPRMYLNGGDVAVTGSYTDFKNEFFRTGELNLISSIPFFLATGNHEGWDVNTKAFTKGITIQSGTEDYYSFDYGNMHVLVLNTQVSYSQGSNQYNFAMADLSSTTKPWKIVISHKPGYCSGGHGEDSGMIAMSQNIFVPAGVDMVISGHSHFYQHNRVSNIEHMVLGGGGAPLYDPTNASYTIKSVKDYNFGIIDINTDTLLLRVYNNLNTLLDTVKIIKHPEGFHGNGTPIRNFSINKVYPNPSNPEFTIIFDIKEDAVYTIELFDEAGKLVDTIKNGMIKSGSYEINYKTEKLSSGTYFVMLTNGKDFKAKKVTVVK